MTPNHDIVSECSDMFTQGLLFQSNSTIQNLFMRVNLEQIILLSLNITCSRYDTAEYSLNFHSLTHSLTLNMMESEI